MSETKEYIARIDTYFFKDEYRTVKYESITDEEIVRCRDCEGAIDDGVSFRCETFMMNGEDPNGFCKWGERR